MWGLSRANHNRGVLVWRRLLQQMPKATLDGVFCLSPLASRSTEMNAVQLAERISATQRGHEFSGRCPAHDDAHASLSFRDADARILVTCHAGCSFAAIVESLGLTAADFYHDHDHHNSNGPRRIVATYDYVDENGTLLYQAVRFDPKNFRQRCPDGNGGWVWKLGGVRRVVYRLPDLQGQPVAYIVEGEKDVERLNGLGLVATTNSGGAGKWTDGFTLQLRQAGVEQVCILPDNDEPGESHAQQVKDSCCFAGLAVKIIRLPGWPPRREKHGEDITDWLGGGHTLEELLAAVEATPLLTSDPPLNAPTPQPLPTEPPHHTDSGNARRLVAQYRADLHYCFPWKTWLVWDEYRWANDETGDVCRRAKQTVAWMYAEAATIQKEKAREALAIHALRSESDAHLKAMISVARSEDGIPVLPTHLDRDPWLLTVRNGTLDLRHGILRPHQREDLITKLVPVEYDATASCMAWEMFLADLFPDQPQVITFLQKAVGYSLTGDTRERCLFFLYGTGANGKTTFMRTIQEIMGDYAKQAAPDLFLSKYGQEHPTGLADLAGSRFVTCTEADEGKRLAEALVKQLTGGDKMKARRMHQDFWEYQPTHKIWLAANHKPHIRGTDHAIWSRIRLIPFTITFHSADSDDTPKQDLAMSGKLRAELPGILRWAVDGCLLWQHEGLDPPEEVKIATKEYRHESDLAARFLEECCQEQPGETVTAKALWEAYEKWCEDHGERKTNRTDLGRRLAERGFISGRQPGSGRKTWGGLTLSL